MDIFVTCTCLHLDTFVTCTFVTCTCLQDKDSTKKVRASVTTSFDILPYQWNAINWLAKVPSHNSLEE